MKFIHTADLHLGTKLGSGDEENFRVKDFLKAFDFIIDKAIEEKVDFFLFVGDAFKNSSPSITLLTEFVKRVKRLVDNKIDFVYIKGNHDEPKVSYLHHSLSVVQELNTLHTYIVDESEILELKCGVRIIAIPFLSESYKSNFQLHFDNLLGGLIEEAKKRTSAPTILALHYYVDGAELSNDYRGPGAISRSFLNKYPWTYVALGDIHKGQTINDNPLSVYPGSIERVTFGERAERKSFIMVEFSNRGPFSSSSVVRVPIPTRPMFRVTQEELGKNDYPEGSIVELELDVGACFPPELLKKFKYVSLVPRRKVINKEVEKLESIDFLSNEYLIVATKKIFPELEEGKRSEVVKTFRELC